MSNRSRLSLFLVGLALLTAVVAPGCTKIKSTTTLNPDGSGKMELTFGLMESSLAWLQLQQGRFAAPGEKNDPLAEFESGEFFAAVDGLGGWTKPERFKKDGYEFIRTTLYFEDINKVAFGGMNGPGGMEGPGVPQLPVTFEKHEDGSFTLKYSGGSLASELTGRGASGIPNPFSRGELSDAAKEQFRKTVRGLLQDYEIDNEWVLPGEVAEAGELKRDGRSVRFAFGTETILKMMEDPENAEALLSGTVTAKIAGDLTAQIETWKKEFAEHKKEGAAVGPRARPGRAAPNEQNAAAGLRTLTVVQAGWRQGDYDGNGIKDFWTADVAGFYAVKNAAGMLRENIAIDFAKADFKPLTEHDQAKGAPVPKQGYYFRVMVVDELGEPYLQMKGADGQLRSNRSKFAFVAFPAEYGKSGRATFIIREDGTVYGKDIGPWPELKKEDKEKAAPKPLTADEEKAVRDALAGLGADSFEDRAKAQEALQALDERALPLLGESLAAAGDPEVKSVLPGIIEGIRSKAGLLEVHELLRFPGADPTVHGWWVEGD